MITIFFIFSTDFSEIRKIIVRVKLKLEIPIFEFE